MERHIDSTEIGKLFQTEAGLKRLRSDYLIQSLGYLESRHSDIVDPAKDIFNALKGDRMLHQLMAGFYGPTTLLSALDRVMYDERDENYLRLSTCRNFELYKRTREEFAQSEDVVKTERRLLLNTSFDFIMELDELTDPLGMPGNDQSL